MIENIETIILDFPNLNSRDEINTYINLQLLNHFPVPEMLVYDYIISGTGGNKKILLSFILKEHLDQFNSIILHPHLLFRKLYRKDGLYRIYCEDTVLELLIENRVYKTVKYLQPGDVLGTNKKEIVISDKKNYERSLSQNSNKIVNLENIYKQCKKDLFKKRKKNSTPHILLILTLAVLIYGVFNLISVYKLSDKRLKELEQKYTLLLQSETGEDLSLLYSEKMDRLLVLESQLHPDLYSIFFELGRWNKDYKILNFNYNNNFLTIVAITENSIGLVETLNRSEMFNFKLNSTVRKENYEQVSFSGEVLCP